MKPIRAIYDYDTISEFANTTKAGDLKKVPNRLAGIKFGSPQAIGQSVDELWIRELPDHIERLKDLAERGLSGDEQAAESAINELKSLAEKATESYETIDPKKQRLVARQADSIRKRLREHSSQYATEVAGNRLTMVLGFIVTPIFATAIGALPAVGALALGLVAGTLFEYAAGVAHSQHPVKTHKLSDLHTPREQAEAAEIEEALVREFLGFGRQKPLKIKGDEAEAVLALYKAASELPPKEFARLVQRTIDAIPDHTLPFVVHKLGKDVGNSPDTCVAHINDQPEEGETQAEYLTRLREHLIHCLITMVPKGQEAHQKLNNVEPFDADEFADRPDAQNRSVTDQELTDFMGS